MLHNPIIFTILAFVAALAIFKKVLLHWDFFYVWAFPELKFFERDKDRASALSRASSSFHGRAWYWMPLVVIQLGLWRFGQSIPNVISGSFSLYLLIFFLFPLAIVTMIYFLVFSKKIRRSLRQQLVQRGYLICINCGYDLRGSPDRCPECGAAVCHGTVSSVMDHC